MNRIKSFLRAVYLLPFHILMGMSANATQAQGTKIYQATGTGGAITITDITSAFRAEVTGTHSLTVGDRVAFASVVGMTQINGLKGTVLAVTSTTSFVVDIDTRAFTAYDSAGTATPETYTAIGDVTKFTPGGATVSDIDVTDLDSEAKEYKACLMDNGEFSMDVQYVGSNAGQVAARAAFEDSLTKGFKITTPDSKVYTFDGYYKKFPTLPDGGVDQVLKGSISVRISGAVSVA